jgi:hypothetical protein
MVIDLKEQPSFAKVTYSIKHRSRHPQHSFRAYHYPYDDLISMLIVVVHNVTLLSVSSFKPFD